MSPPSPRPTPPGRSARDMAARRFRAALWTALVGVIVLIGIIYLPRYAGAIGLGGMGVLIALILINVFPGLVLGSVEKKLKAVRQALRGAQAEETVGAVLAALTADFFVLHDVQSPLGNIDHVVIRRGGGVYLIETKSHGGRVEVLGETLLVDGRPPEKDFIAQALNNAYWLRSEIGRVVGQEPWITPVIVFTEAFVTVARPVKNVHLLNLRYLPGILYKPHQPDAADKRVWQLREQIRQRLELHQ